MPTWHTPLDSTSRQQTLNQQRAAGAASGRRYCVALVVLAGALAIITADPRELFAAGGSLKVNLRDEAEQQPVAARLELYRGELSGSPIAIRRTVSAGFGAVLDRELTLTLPDGNYAFRVTRGPEYRVVSGTFLLERTSLDEHSLALPRMVDMLELGWTSGDCCVPASAEDLPLRMAAEDLHVAAVLGDVAARPVPKSEAGDPVPLEPTWISRDLSRDEGLLFYGPTEATAAAGESAAANATSSLPWQRLAQLDPGSESTRVAVANPFAWPLPVWLASGRIDGFFILGDWLRLDRPIVRPADGRPPEQAGFGDGPALGRAVLRTYWNLLEAGFKIAPLAGSGPEGTKLPVGYNRLYVAELLESAASYDPTTPEEFPTEARRVPSPERWWTAAWSGQSVATNGPLLRPKLGGKLPGHTFTAREGEVLELAVELTLSVRDPVDYLEVIHNGSVHYSARLDEFALAGGKIPPLSIDESGWVLVQVVTGYEGHLRAATSAPWYIEFDGRRRVTPEAVSFFQRWQSDYEQRLAKLPPAEIQRHAPAIQAARRFWLERSKTSP